MSTNSAVAAVTDVVRGLSPTPVVNWVEDCRAKTVVGGAAAMTAFDFAVLLLRVSLGLTMAAHGYHKVFLGGRLAGNAIWFEGLGMRPGFFHVRVAAGTEIIARRCSRGWTVHLRRRGSVRCPDAGCSVDGAPHEGLLCDDVRLGVHLRHCDNRRVCCHARCRTDKHRSGAVRRQPGRWVGRSRRCGRGGNPRWRLSTAPVLSTIQDRDGGVKTLLERLWSSRHLWGP